MDVCEFKAWFEGFTEDMSGQPNTKQWKRIKARVKQIDGTATTERVFIDRYWGRYQPYLTVPTMWSSTGTNMSNVNTITTPRDCVSTAFTALGKAEAASIAA